MLPGHTSAFHAFGFRFSDIAAIHDDHRLRSEVSALYAMILDLGATASISLFSWRVKRSRTILGVNFSFTLLTIFRQIVE